MNNYTYLSFLALGALASSAINYARDAGVSSQPAAAQSASQKKESMDHKAQLDQKMMEGMEMDHADPHLGLHEIQPSEVIKVGENVDWTNAVGFGRLAGMIGMMNAMMVAGSGMESMKMAPMMMEFSSKTFAPIGTVVVMPNGTHAETPPQGIKSGSDSRPTQLIFDDNPASSGPVIQGHFFRLTLKNTAAKVGSNDVKFTLTGSDGKPITQAKIAVTVQMESMDMGTTQPEVKELGNGDYEFSPTLSMAGPWSAKVMVTSDGKSEVFKVLFTAK